MRAAVAAIMWAAILDIPFAWCENDRLIDEGTPTEQVVSSYKPFEFAFESDDGLGTTQHRRESADAGGAVTGAYGYVDPLGVYRTVEYVADAAGFRAVVRTNEPGTAPQSPADALWIVQEHPTAEADTQEFTSARALLLEDKNANNGTSYPEAGYFFRPRQMRPFPFPIFAQTKGVITIQLPVSQKPRNKTAKPAPKDANS